MLNTLCSNVKYFTSGFIKGAWDLKEHWRKKACLDARSVKVSVITDSLNSTQVHVGEDTFEAVSTFQYLGDVTGESGGGAGLLKGGGGSWHFSYLIFSIFIIFKFRITLPFAKLCHAFEEKVFFFRHHNFKKKGHSKLSKNEPENLP